MCGGVCIKFMLDPDLFPSTASNRKRLKLNKMHVPISFPVMAAVLCWKADKNL